MIKLWACTCPKTGTFLLVALSYILTLVFCLFVCIIATIIGKCVIMKIFDAKQTNLSNWSMTLRFLIYFIFSDRSVIFKLYRTGRIFFYCMVIQLFSYAATEGDTVAIQCIFITTLVKINGTALVSKYIFCSPGPKGPSELF